MSKGSARRPKRISDAEFEERWKEAFSKGKFFEKAIREVEKLRQEVEK